MLGTVYSQRGNTLDSQPLMADSTADAGSRSSIRTATPQLSFWASAAVGGCSGATVDCVLFPLDTLKTRLQQRRQPGAQLPALQLRSFYRGLLSAMTGSFPSAATFWGVYEASKAATSHLAPPDDELQQGVRHAVCGATADVASAIVRNPFEVRLPRVQAQLCEATNAPACIPGREAADAGWAAPEHEQRRAEHPTCRGPCRPVRWGPLDGGTRRPVQRRPVCVV